MNKIPESYSMTSMSPICINVKPFTGMNSKALDIKTFQLLVPSAAFLIVHYQKNILVDFLHYPVFTKFSIG